MLAVIIIYTILIFPLFLTISAKYDKSVKVFFVTFAIFNARIITVAGKIFPSGLIINITNNKTIIIPLTKLFYARKKVEPLKDYHFIKFNFELEVGKKDNALQTLFLAHNINAFFNYFHWFLTCHKPHVKIDNAVKIHLDKNELKLKAKLVILFNLLMILLSLFKILVGKINYAFKKR